MANPRATLRPHTMPSLLNIIPILVASGLTVGLVVLMRSARLTDLIEFFYVHYYTLGADRAGWNSGRNNVWVLSPSRLGRSGSAIS